MYRIMQRVVTGMALVLASCSPGLASGESHTLAHLRTVHDGVAHEGSGVLVRMDGPGGVAQILTAGPLFRRSNGEPATDPIEVTLGGQTFTVLPDQVNRPVGDLTGVALVTLRNVTVQTAITPLDRSDPSLGGVFVIAGMVGGARVDVPQRVQFVATRIIVGDRALAMLPACLGAPALSPSGVFGVVTDCQPGRAPVVTLVSAARAFLDRHLVAMRTSELQRPSPVFAVSERLLDGPLMTVACNEVNAGEILVPYQLGRNEKPVDASASFLNASEVRLADLTVLRLDDRQVRLRFTMVGVPPAPYEVPGPNSCRQGQALVTVRLNLVVLPPQ